MNLLYCAVLFTHIIFWDSEPIKFHRKETSKHALRVVKELNYVSAKHGHESRQWAVSLKTCEEIPAKDRLQELSFFVSFHGDGRVCWNRDE
jgi:hypothetical protein